MPENPLRERLYSRLIIDWDSGCLLWTGFRDTKGYGRMMVGSRTDGSRCSERVHRVAWQLENGPIPPELHLDHVRALGCLYRHCGNIAHLEAVTPGENVLRGDGPTAINAVKMRCDSGHEFTDANTYWRTNGNRDCRACKRDRDSRRVRARAS